MGRSETVEKVSVMVKKDLDIDRERPLAEFQMGCDFRDKYLPRPLTRSRDEALALCIEIGHMVSRPAYRIGAHAMHLHPTHAYRIALHTHGRHAHRHIIHIIYHIHYTTYHISHIIYHIYYLIYHIYHHIHILSYHTYISIYRPHIYRTLHILHFTYN